MQSLKANQYVIKNGKLIPKNPLSQTKTNYRQIQYEHTIRKVSANSILYDMQANTSQKIINRDKQHSSHQYAPIQQGHGILRNFDSLQKHKTYVRFQQQKKCHTYRNLGTIFQNINLRISPSRDKVTIKNNRSLSLHSQTICENCINVGIELKNQLKCTKKLFVLNQISNQHQNSAIQASNIGQIGQLKSKQIDHYNPDNIIKKTQIKEVEPVINIQNKKKDQQIQFLKDTIKLYEEMKIEYENKLYESQASAQRLQKQFKNKLSQLQKKVEIQYADSVDNKSKLCLYERQMQSKDATIFSLIGKLRGKIHSKTELQQHQSTEKNPKQVTLGPTKEKKVKKIQVFARKHRTPWEQQK